MPAASGGSRISLMPNAVAPSARRIFMKTPRKDSISGSSPWISVYAMQPTISTRIREGNLARGRPAAHDLRMRAWRRSSGAQRAAVLGLLLLIVLWLPGTLASDVRGLRSLLRLSSRARAETTGPGARAGSDLALLRLARATIPDG